MSSQPDGSRGASRAAGAPRLLGCSAAIFREASSPSWGVLTSRRCIWRVPPCCSCPTFRPQKATSSSRPACAQSPKPLIYLSFSDAFPRPLFGNLTLLLLLTELGRAGAGEALSKGTMRVSCSVTSDSPHRPGRWCPEQGVWLRDVAKSEGRNPWQAVELRQWAAEVELRYRTLLKGEWPNLRASSVWQQRRSPKKQGTLK